MSAGNYPSIKSNVILNIIRQFGGILFSLITFPYLSRVLQAENYGKLNFGSSIIVYFSLVAALGINDYAVREGAGLRDDKKAIGQFSNQILTINLITTAIAYFLLAFTLLSWNKLSDYRLLIAIQSLSILFTTIGLDWLYNVYEDYVYITIQNLIVRLVIVVLTFLFVKEAEDYILYAFITVTATGGGSLLNLIHARKYIRLKLTGHLEFKKHIKPMLILFWSAVTISIYLSSDITILGLLKNDATVGIYSVSVKIYSFVKNILNAIITVTLSRLSYYVAANRLTEYKKLAGNILKILLTVMMPTLTGLFMVSKNAILIISGEAYISGQYSLKILCFALGFSAVGYFFTTSVLLPHKKESKVFFCTLVSALANLILNFLLIPRLSLNGAAITTVLAEGIVMITAIWWSRDIFDFRGYKNVFLSSLSGCIGIIIVCTILDQFAWNLFLDTGLKIILSVLIYFIILLIGKNEALFKQIS